MTEKEKMLRSMLYDANDDPGLAAERARAITEEDRSRSRDRDQRKESEG